MNPLLTIMVPTIGRPTLKGSLLSVANRAEGHSVEVLVVGDHYGGDTAELGWAREVTEQLGYTYLKTDTGKHDYSHSNRQVALDRCNGHWLVILDDDDIFTGTALGHICAAIERQREPRPLMFKMRSPEGELLWDRPRLRQGRMGSGNFVCPILPRDKVGEWTSEYEGDFAFIASTLKYYGNTPEWRDEIITLTRATPEDYWWTW